MSRAKFSRRQVLVGGSATAVILAAGGAGAWREFLEGSPAPQPYPHRKPGPMISGTFHSRFRRREVRWSASYPPGYSAGAVLPVSLVLHGYGADHYAAFNSLHLQYAQAQLVRGVPIPPIVLAAADGGNAYWHRRVNGDDPLGMLVQEFLPLLSSHGLIVNRVAVLGWSMGGYGALLLGENHPQLISHIAAESPVIWPNYAASQGANPSAFDSEDDWHTNSVVGHLDRLDGIPIRIDCGESDPFLLASQDLAHRLRPDSVHFEPGGHDAFFWQARGPVQLRFLTTN